MHRIGQVAHLAFIDIDRESLRRGGTTRFATCCCGWRGPSRATLELATDDALQHEGSDMWITSKP
jgi:hypothetical protein